MLEVTQLCKGFPDESKYGRVKAVDEVSFTVKEGHFFTMLGPSGCGKTTTLRCIAGLEKPDSGHISVGDRVLFSSTERISVVPSQRNLGHGLPELRDLATHERLQQRGIPVAGRAPPPHQQERSPSNASSARSRLSDSATWQGDTRPNSPVVNSNGSRWRGLW